MVVLLAGVSLVGCANSSAPDLAVFQPATGAASPATTGSESIATSTKLVTKSESAGALQTSAPVKPASESAPDAYRIGPQDVLDISVFKVPELARTVQVTDMGSINLPLVGEIRAAGRTSQEIETELAQKLGAKYLRSPQVSVSIKEYNSQRITVDGAVMKPGIYEIKGKTTLLQVIDTAGGLNEAADNTDVAIFREKSGKRDSTVYNFDSIRSGDSVDPVLKAGDVVVANPSAFKQAFQDVLKALPLAGLVKPIP